jgi:hypothetical protein
MIMLTIASVHDFFALLTCVTGVSIAGLAVLRLLMRFTRLDNRAEHIYIIILGITISFWVLISLVGGSRTILPLWEWSALLLMVFGITWSTIYASTKVIPTLENNRVVFIILAILSIIVLSELFLFAGRAPLWSIVASLAVGLVFIGNAILLTKAAFTIQDGLFKLAALSLCLLSIGYLGDIIFRSGLSSPFWQLTITVSLLLFVLTMGLLGLDNAYLQSMYFMNQKIEEARQELAAQTENIEDVVISLARTIDAKDKYTEGHTERVSQYAVFLGERLGLTERKLETLRIGALIHDLGKIGIDLSILNKPGHLTEEEFEEIKLHPALGQQICSPLKALQEVGDIIRHHHERLDGSGYPDGLRDEEISQNARIVAVVDVFDALTTERSYKKALSPEEALCIMREEAAQGQLDSRIVQEFESMLYDLGVTT